MSVETKIIEKKPYSYLHGLIKGVSVKEETTVSGKIVRVKQDYYDGDISNTVTLFISNGKTITPIHCYTDLETAKDLLLNKDVVAKIETYGWSCHLSDCQLQTDKDSIEP